MILTSNAPLKIGLFGGTFDPVHAGHIRLANTALRRLQLDFIWCLVTPQNPLKPHISVKTRDERARILRRAMAHPRISVLDIAQMPKAECTADMLWSFTERFRNFRFVWLMGADSLADFHLWKRWECIFYTLPIAVFARSEILSSACLYPAARAFRKSRISNSNAIMLADSIEPAWCYVNMPLCNISSTTLRHATN